MISPSKTTNRQLQNAIQEIAMLNLETSIFWNMSTETLNAMESSIRSNRRINHDVADRIAEILRRRGGSDAAASDHFAEMMEAINA